MKRIADNGMNNHLNFTMNKFLPFLAFIFVIHMKSWKILLIFWKNITAIFLEWETFAKELWIIIIIPIYLNAEEIMLLIISIKEKKFPPSVVEDLSFIPIKVWLNEQIFTIIFSSHHPTLADFKETFWNYSFYNFSPPPPLAFFPPDYYL